MEDLKLMAHKNSEMHYINIWIYGKVKDKVIPLQAYGAQRVLRG
jgi:hypothetical protein